MDRTHNQSSPNYDADSYPQHQLSTGIRVQYQGEEIINACAHCAPLFRKIKDLFYLRYAVNHVRPRILDKVGQRGLSGWLDDYGTRTLRPVRPEANSRLPASPTGAR